MRISLIIPVYNEAGAIDRCLANLEALEGEAEVLFADGGSTDGTLEKLAGRRVPRDGLGQIAAAVGRGTRFGCFHIGFDYRGPFMGCNTVLSNLRARLWRIAFGDQGMFMTRALFLQAGGFPELPIMEDYEFSRRMRRAGVPLRLLPGRIITSGRRYRTGGCPLAVMWRMFHLRCLYRAGVDIHEIARRYRDVR